MRTLIILNVFSLIVATAPWLTQDRPVVGSTAFYREVMNRLFQHTIMPGADETLIRVMHDPVNQEIQVRFRSVSDDSVVVMDIWHLQGASPPIHVLLDQMAASGRRCVSSSSDLTECLLGRTLSIAG
jgi:hypothetical protein